jgi:hypothetical protein
VSWVLHLSLSPYAPNALRLRRNLVLGEALGVRGIPALSPLPKPGPGDG